MGAPTSAPDRRVQLDCQETPHQNDRSVEHCRLVGAIIVAPWSPGWRGLELYGGVQLTEGEVAGLEKCDGSPRSR
jgi:hypothetical protein